jgi:hypothetical protein
MAASSYPAQLARDGVVVTARTAQEYWNYRWAGYTPINAPVPVDEDDSFNDEAVAALILNADSATFKALVQRFISSQQLMLRQTPPATAPPGTVWIDTSP